MVNWLGTAQTHNNICVWTSKQFLVVLVLQSIFSDILGHTVIILNTAVHLNPFKINYLKKKRYRYLYSNTAWTFSLILNHYLAWYCPEFMFVFNDMKICNYLRKVCHILHALVSMMCLLFNWKTTCESGLSFQVFLSRQLSLPWN